MKLNNYGWGLKEFLWLLCALAFFFTIAIVLFHKLMNLETEDNKNSTIELFGDDSSSIKTYIDSSIIFPME